MGKPLSSNPQESLPTMQQIKHQQSNHVITTTSVNSQSAVGNSNKPISNLKYLVLKKTN